MSASSTSRTASGRTDADHATASRSLSSELPNGIRVLTESIPHTRGVGMAVLIDAGPQDETDSTPGLAHLTEHAFFLGTQQRCEREIAGLIDTAGGQLGGFTARDYTCLHATVSSDYVTYAMDLLGDMLCGLQTNEERLQREIDVIGHEIDDSDDDPDTWLDGQLKNVMWPGDPLGRSLLGTRESLSRLSADAVMEFVRTQYTPDRIIVAAAGHVDHDTFVEQTHDALWQLSGYDRRQPRSAAKTAGGVIVEKRQQRSATVSVMLPTPTYTDADRYALHVLVALLGGGMSSRLYRELRERQSLVYSASAQWHAYGRGGVLTIDASTTPDTIMPTLMGIIAELTRLAWDDSSITEEELWKAKMQVRGQAYLASDSISTRVSRLATQQLYFGHALPEDELLDAIDVVDRATVCRVAARVLGSGLATTAIGVTGALDRCETTLCNEINDLRACFEMPSTNLS